MPRVVYLCKSEAAASTRYRATQFFGLLSQADWEPRLIDLDRVGPDQALAHARQADVTVVVRRTFGPWLRHRLRRAARRLVFDFDDAIYLSTSGRRWSGRARRFGALVRQCDQIWAGNPHLARRAGRYNRQVHVVPTALDPNRYNPPAPRSADPIDAVWIGSSSTRPYLEMALPALQAAARQTPGLRLKIVADFDLPNAGLPTLAVPWTEDGEAAALRSSHLGLAPMPDTPWTRGKCGLKVLQYMSARLPVVSSAAGVNRDMVQPGRTGFLADTPEQWATAIATLARDPAQSQPMGEQGRAVVDQTYALDVVGARIVTQLNRLCVEPA